MNKTAVALAVLLPFTVQAQTNPTTLQWTAPTTTEDGNAISSEWQLQYRFYARVAGTQDAFNDYLDTAETSLDLSNVDAGCMDMYITTIVVNLTPLLESVPSNRVTACFNLSCGEVGIDGTTGACEGDPVDPVDPTKPEDPDVIVPLPNAPTELQMTVRGWIDKWGGRNKRERRFVRTARFDN